MSEDYEKEAPQNGPSLVDPSLRDLLELAFVFTVISVLSFLNGIIELIEGTFQDALAPIPSYYREARDQGASRRLALVLAVTLGTSRRARVSDRA